MKGIKNNLIKTGYMTDDQKVMLAWNDMEIAVAERKLSRVFQLAYIIKAITKKYEDQLKGKHEADIQY